MRIAIVGTPNKQSRTHNIMRAHTLAALSLVGSRSCSLALSDFLARTRALVLVLAPSLTLSLSCSLTLSRSCCLAVSVSHLALSRCLAVSLSPCLLARFLAHALALTGARARSFSFSLPPSLLHLCTLTAEHNESIVAAPPTNSLVALFCRIRVLFCGYRSLLRYIRM